MVANSSAPTRSGGPAQREASFQKSDEVFARQHRLLTRRRIVDSALEVFASKGYAATTIEDVVARAGVARGTFYLHFKNKLAIVQAVTAEGFQPVAALYEDLDVLVTSGDRNRDNMREWMIRAIEWFETHRTMATVWQELPSTEPEFELPSFLIAGRMRRYLAQWPESEQGARACGSSCWFSNWGAPFSSPTSAMPSAWTTSFSSTC